MSKKSSKVQVVSSSKADSSLSETKKMMTDTRTTGSSSLNSSSSNVGNLLFLFVVGPIYVLIRIVVANKMPIMDCDEVYNYWEPLHYLLYGTGLQTWEYSNEYALRTYAYLLPLKYIAQYIYIPAIQQQPYRNYLYLISQEILSIDQLPASTDRVLLFLLLRCTVAATTAFCEFYWLYTLLVYQQQRRTVSAASSLLTTSTSTVLYTTLLSLSAAGMNHSAGALLPSTTWMAAWCLCAATFLREKHIWFAIIAITATLSVGWPFGCVCVIPMGLHILYKEYYYYNNGGTIQLVRYLFTLLLITIFVQYNVMQIDEIYYGIQYISPTWNIFKYNAAGNGDELYGVEPISYYIKNLLLNFNFVALFGVLSLPTVLLYNWWWYKKPSRSTTTTTESCNSLDYNIVSVLLSLPIWFLITVPRPHKEERFMYPIYPVLVFGSVLTVQFIVRYLMIQEAQGTSATTGGICSICRFVYRITKRCLLLHSQIIPILLFSVCIIISIFRTMALSKYYTAPLVAYNKLAHQPVPTEEIVRAKYEYNISKYGYTGVPNNYVCTCGEWYRYPSSFYLPDDTQLGFLKSSFKGQLPQPFTKYGSLPESRIYLQPFNDRNEHVEQRYVNDTSMRYDCKWFVVLHSEDEDTYCGWPYLYGKARIAFAPFLDATKTKSTFHRTLYIPFGNYHDNARWTDQIDYDEYVIYAEYDNYIFNRLTKYEWETTTPSTSSSSTTTTKEGSNNPSQGEL